MGEGHGLYDPKLAMKDQGKDRGTRAQGYAHLTSKTHFDDYVVNLGGGGVQLVQIQHAIPKNTA